MATIAPIALSLPSWAESALPSAAGWHEIPQTQLRTVCPPDNFGGTTYGFTSLCPQVVAAWNSGVLDTARNRLVVWGGGHNDYAGNELYALNLDDLTIERLDNPSIPTNAGGACSVTTLSDGRPNSRHTYDGLAYMSRSDKMFVFGGSLACSGGYLSNDTWVFDFATSTWQRKNPSGTIPNALPGIVTAYDPATDRVFLHDDRNLYSYDLATDRYTHLATDEIDYHLSAVIDPVQKKLVLTGGGQAWAYDIGPGSSYVRQTLATTGGGAIVDSLYPGLAFDPVSERIVAWHGGDTVYSLDLATGAWTPATFAGGPGPAQQNGTFKRWSYSPASGAFVLVNSMTQNAYALRLGPISTTTQAPGGPSPSSGSTFTLLAPATQAFAPFTIGLGFRKGDVTTPALDIPDAQVVVMRRWNDGSVKHAIASGHVALTANVARVITAAQSATPPTGTKLTAASIQAANPQASVAFGAAGTVNLSAMLATPFRTFVSGPEMVEAHYRGQAGNDPTLVAWFHVRLYKGGRMWIRAIADNGFLDLAGQTKSYVPVVSIGGTQVWNNGGAALTHYANTRWTQEAWIGGDPQIAPRLDTAYLKAARLVPNFLAATADAAALDALTQTYAPNQRGNWTQAMGDTGYQDQIGLLPLWDALYIASGGDARAYRSVVANAKALNSYPINWTDSVTKVQVKPSERPGWGLDGSGGEGSTSRAAGALTWEIAHHGSGGYLAYLITGDHFHLETMAGQAATAYLAAGATDWTATPEGPNLGTSRYFNGQTRGYAWVLRTLSQYVAIAPAGDAIAADYSALLANNIGHLRALQNTVVPAGTGYVYEYDASLYGSGLVAPWQQHFFIQALGMGSDLEPLADMTAYTAVRDYLYRGAVGILGDGSGYCFTQAAVYNLKSNAGTGIAPNSWYKTWAEVYAATFAAPPACTNTLAGTSGSDPALAARGFWGNLLPAIAYAVDHGAPGAGAAWARLSGAANWNAVLQSGFENTPTWGVVPRAQAPPLPGLATLDVDGNGAVDALTDGLIIFRYLFGLTGPTLTAGATASGATRTAHGAVLQYLDSIRGLLEVDGNASVDALTDGLILIRYLFGMRGTALVVGAHAGDATRTDAQIQAYIQSLAP